MLPLNQLLNKVPDKIVPIPIHNSSIVPLRKLPTIALLVRISKFVISSRMIPSGICDKPFTMDTTIINNPETKEKILMKLVGVGLPSALMDLSMSKARMIKAQPKMLRTSATASLVNPKIVEIPLANNNAPGTPRKNLEYLASYTNILMYLAKIA